MKTEKELIRIVADEMQEMLENDPNYEDLKQKFREVRNKVFGKAPTFVTKQGVVFYRGPNEREAQKEIEEDVVRFKEMLQNLQPKDFPANPEKLHEAFEAQCQRKIRAAQWEDKKLQIHFAEKHEKSGEVTP
jgi:hypothetical protein